MSNSSFENHDYRQADHRTGRPRVVLLTGSGRRPGILGTILGGLLLIAVIALIASFAVVFAALFAAALLVVVAAATIRHLWRSITGRNSGPGNFADSGVQFSGRIVVTSSGPVRRKTITPPVTLLEALPTDSSQVLTEDR
ncbi:MAG: hypothetical protein ACKO2P_03835 [Planctomycetota bacterium]